MPILGIGTLSTYYLMQTVPLYIPCVVTKSAIIWNGLSLPSSMGKAITRSLFSKMQFRKVTQNKEATMDHQVTTHSSTCHRFYYNILSTFLAAYRTIYKITTCTKLIVRLMIRMRTTMLYVFIWDASILFDSDVTHQFESTIATSYTASLSTHQSHLLHWTHRSRFSLS